MDNHATLEKEIVLFESYRDRCLAREAVYETISVNSDVTFRMQHILAAQIQFFEDLIEKRKAELSVLHGSAAGRAR